ncbi:hypothetical protein Q5H92_09010 [Hymenobacter sp. M29]|uniref:Uncharacterized protein n=1 Tax=Hymenobacter mellowenesis TaxID=3063995 RepID=A0ABT9A9H9_9BACT|nr:hypothetical protein [Hymenobacter sp. M29]MDO7846495.1 hypothetical protein [Hymenobacter sp. M29]
MFYYYTDAPFENRVIRLIRADDGQPGLSDGLLAVLRQTHEKHANVVAFIKDYNNVYHAFRNNEERALWESYLKQYPLLQDDYYQWTRANTEE